MAGKLELAALDGVLVDGGGDQHVHLGGGQILHRGLEAEPREFAGGRVRLAPVGFEQRWGDVDAVQGAGLGVGRILDVPDVEAHIELGGLLAQGFGMAVDHRQQVFEEPLIRKGLEDALGPDSVGVSPGQSDAGGLLLRHGAKVVPEPVRMPLRLPPAGGDFLHGRSPSAGGARLPFDVHASGVPPAFLRPARRHDGLGHAQPGGGDHLPASGRHDL